MNFLKADLDSWAHKDTYMDTMDMRNTLPEHFSSALCKYESMCGDKDTFPSLKVAFGRQLW